MASGFSFWIQLIRSLLSALLGRLGDPLFSEVLAYPLPAEGSVGRRVSVLSYDAGERLVFVGSPRLSLLHRLQFYAGQLDALPSEEILNKK